MSTAITILIMSTLALLGIGGYLYFRLFKVSFEKHAISELSQLIEEGLQAFRKRVMSSILQIVIYVTVVFFVFSIFFKRPLIWSQIMAFFLGCLIMAGGTYINLVFLPRMLPRVLQRCKGFLYEGVSVLYAASMAMGFLVVGVVLFGFGISYLLLGVESLVGFSLGVALSAFFLRIGGGLFKAGADIGADVLSSIEKSIPAFDKRNPGTILDMAGDHIGDAVGFWADMVSTFVLAVVAVIMAAYSLHFQGMINVYTATKLLSLPLYLVAIGFMASIVTLGFGFWRIFKTPIVDNMLMEGIYLAVVICGIGTGIVIFLMNITIDHAAPLTDLKRTFVPYLAYVVGLIGAVLIAVTSEYLTSHRFRPAQRVAREAEYGPVVSLLNGVSIGLRGNAFFLLYVICVIAFSYYFAGFYGIALAAMGMVSVTPLIVAANIFQQMASNAYKVVQLTDGHDPIVKNTYKMDQMGHAVAALGNAFAVGVAVLATFSLFFSLVMITEMRWSYLMMVDVRMLIGLVLGISLPYIFSGYLLRGLNQIVQKVMFETRRQFKEIPYLFEGKARPDVNKASDDISIIAMNAMVIPGLLMLLVPIVIAYLFGMKMLLGFAFGTFLSGFNQGYYWGNFGDALHNAKHYIFSGFFGGKESPTYQHIKIADNVGDGFKDVLSPSMNILIKSVTIISILLILMLT